MNLPVYFSKLPDEELKPETRKQFKSMRRIESRGPFKGHITDGMVYGPSILENIRESKTEEQIHANLLRALKEVPASASTKRKWRKAAEARIGQLRAQTLVRVA